VRARARIFVSGRVQGVFFRGHTERWALSLSLTGWVRNRFDGRVEIVVEGEKPDIEELIVRVGKGPPRARVEGVDVAWSEDAGEFDEFRVHPTDF